MLKNKTGTVVDSWLMVNKQRMILPLLIVTSFVGLGGTGYFYAKYRELKTNPNAEAKREAEKIVSKVSVLMVLPTDETPTIATISDKEKLKDQPFFRDAENEDVLLAYTKSMLAILYRPSANRIINVAPITINAKSATTTTTVSATLRIAYMNGTNEVGLSGATEKIVQQRYPTYQTAVLTNAAKKNYTKTLVVDLSGTRAAETNALADLLHGNVSALPPGESAPDADVLIIAGK